MKYAHLMKISVEGNHNIEYKMRETEDGNFTIEIASYGVAPVRSKRPMCLWDRTYNRKISEGFIDRAGYCALKNDRHHLPIPDYSVAKLWDELNSYSREAIEENYEMSISDVSEAMLQDVEILLRQLSEEDIPLLEFNNILCRIFLIMPRRMKNVSSMIAIYEDDIPRIVERENELFDMVKAQIMTETISSGKTILESLGLEIRCCTPSEEEQILNHLHYSTRPLFSKAYRVKNSKTEKNFWNFYDRNGYTKENIHYYYHGSRNENWLGIINSGLKLSPKATRNGSMFGANLYTAPKSDKSQKYTSLKGSFWAHGASDKGFIAVYKVLYKNPRHVYQWDSSMSQISKENIAPYDSLYCHGGPGFSLRNDECVLPYEEQVTIQYLIKLAM